MKEIFQALKPSSHFIPSLQCLKGQIKVQKPDFTNHRKKTNRAVVFSCRALPKYSQSAAENNTYIYIYIIYIYIYIYI